MTTETVDSLLEEAMALLDTAARLQRFQHHLNPTDIGTPEAERYQAISHAGNWVFHILRGTALSRRRTAGQPAHYIRTMRRQKKREAQP